MTHTQAVPSLESLADDYIALAHEIHRFIGAMSGPSCASCQDPCCEPDHCSSLAESPWLQFVATRAGATIPNATPYNFLGPNGCTLAAGRPIQCTVYICDPLALEIRDPIDRFAYQIASDALPHVVRRLTRNLDLTDVEELDTITDKQRQRIAKRLTEAHTALKRVIHLRERRHEQAGVEKTLCELLRIAQLFPYAARHVRFDGNLPTLSSAARKRLRGKG
jgi:hypothetical protein